MVKSQSHFAAAVSETEREFQIDRLYQIQSKEAVNHFGFKKPQAKKLNEGSTKAENGNSALAVP